MEKSKLEHFQKKVFNFYKTEGRHTLPWRNTNDPYCILVSEIMLQQTQVDRVIPKYNEFLRLFPTVKDLSQASLSDVLRIWSGLGYNRYMLYFIDNIFPFNNNIPLIQFGMPIQM